MRNLTSIDFIDTYSAAYRKEIFTLNNGFDEFFRVPSVEDQELSFRLARKGYRLVFEPSAVVYHYHDRNLSEYLHRKFVIGYWKAVMLKWIPEKVFSDSHTAPTQRVEILLLALLLTTLPFIIVFPYNTLLALLFLLTIFIGIASPFLAFIGKRDPSVLWVAPWLLFGRAGALGWGLLRGIIQPNKRKVDGFALQSPGTRILKRIIDIVGSCFGLILSTPVIACAMFAIPMDSRGPIFFRQVRAGENGKPFTMIKLRTMVDGAERMVSEVLDRSQLKRPGF